MCRNAQRSSVGRKLLIALLMIMLISVLVPTRGAEVGQSKEGVQTPQHLADAVAVVEGFFILDVGRRAVSIIHSENKAGIQSPVILVYSYRGPPVLS